MPGFPTINGLDYSFSSVQFSADAIPFLLPGLKSANYDDGLKPSEARGTNAQVTSRGRGPYNAKGSLEFWKSQWVAARRALVSASTAAGFPGGIKQFEFDFVASYFETAVGLTTDYCLRCRITDESEGHSEDGAVLIHKCDLHIIQINWDGQIPFDTALLPASE